MAQIDEREHRDPQTYAIIGAAMEVHKTLGAGFLESVYQACLEMEFDLRGLPFAREVEVPIYYKGRNVELRHRIDFVCYGEVLVELKALSRLTAVEDAQVINYLRATRADRALLLNFGTTSLQYRRFAYSTLRKMSSASSAQSAVAVPPPNT